MQTNGSLLKKTLALAIPFIVLSSYFVLASAPDLRSSVPLLVGATAIITLCISTVAYMGENGMLTWSPATIILVAMIMRTLFIFRPPELSDDIYRYLWDGLQMIHGNNPYANAPADFVEQDGNVLLLKRVNHPELVTIYPPAAQIVFAVSAFLFKSATGIKFVLILFDLAACLLIMKLLSVLNLPAWRSVLYAWHPLPVLEIAGSGHIDGTGIFFLYITLLLLPLKSAILPGNILRPVLAGAAYGVSSLVKLFPLILIPCFLIMLTGVRRIAFIAGFVAAVILLVVPFTPQIQHMLNTLFTYMHHWEFSSFIFRTLRNYLNSGETARLILTVFFLVATAAIIIFLQRGNSRNGRNSDISTDSLIDLLRALYAITIAFLALTPTLHPWYVLSLVCFFPFIHGVAGIILSWSVFLSYQVLIDYSLLEQWIENDLVAFAIWGAPAAALLLSFFIKKIARCQSRSSSGTRR